MRLFNIKYELANIRDTMNYNGADERYTPTWKKIICFFIGASIVLIGSISTINI